MYMIFLKFIRKYLFCYLCIIKYLFQKIIYFTGMMYNVYTARF